MTVHPDHSVTCPFCDDLADERETISLWVDDYADPTMQSKVAQFPDGEAHENCFDAAVAALDQDFSWERELTHCPDCGAGVVVTDQLESSGEGMAFSHIKCTDECGFRAREEFVHAETKRLTQ